MIWGGITGHGLTSLHFLPQRQTLTTDYYKKQMLEKKVKPFLLRRSNTKEPTKRKLFSNKQSMVFVQDGAPAHIPKGTQEPLEFREERRMARLLA